MPIIYLAGLAPVAASPVVASLPVAGPPTDGVGAVGALVLDTDGVTWVCSEAGAPGVWIPAAAHANYSALKITGAGATAGEWLKTTAVDNDDGLGAVATSVSVENPDA